ncbi:sugar ABC transporter substrate-binding protein [Clostridium cellulovorans]|uniref:ABC-type sugar transport system periplasmic component-like protein n=1 Tax=Clostridium cellulovorans (strain ATCC 35296 / DSM 3052 / OCM 3 / 743B) TaxID=573061 RepID=D9SQV0_CLOC7|nr:sugar ABC transporter substrate-binding protein [Clostridium cellulovorans]ADL52306.1 ABC-type sugar transport system periplasmic component-like protein [Clostridium cellulovorans 743B]
MKKRIIAIISVVLITGSIFAGCGQKAETKGDSSSNSKTLYFVPIVDTGAYWSPMKKAAQDEANALGYDLVFKTSPSNESQKNEKHLGFLDEAIQNDAAGIAVSPMDPDMFDKKVKEIKDEDIPVVTFDADVKTKDNRTAYVGTDNKLAGEELGKQAGEYLKSKGIKTGKIALAAVNLTQTTMTYRQEGIKKGFEKAMGSDAANFTWLEPIQDNDQAAESKKQLEGQITANQDMVAVFSLGSEGPDTGVMEAIKSQNKAGKIYHFGFDYTPTWENGVESGLITGIVDQDSYAIGKTVIDVLDKQIKGEKIDDNYPVPVKWIPADQIVEYGKEKQKQFTTETK